MAAYIGLTASLFALSALLSAVVTVMHDDPRVRLSFLMMAVIFGLLAFAGFRL